MSRRQLAWIGAIGLSLFFLLVTAMYAYKANALLTTSPNLIGAAAWALGVLVALCNLLGLLGAIREQSRSLALGILNSLSGRLVLIALSLGLGALFLVAALRVEQPRTWSCRILHRPDTAAPDRSRCAEEEYVQMRSFVVRLQRASALERRATLNAQVLDRGMSSVAVDSDRGGLCVATGPDRPTRGVSQLVLSADCGADRQYDVNLHLCDKQRIARAADPAAELRAVVRLEVQEGEGIHADRIECK